MKKIQGTKMVDISITITHRRLVSRRLHIGNVIKLHGMSCSLISLITSMNLLFIAPLCAKGYRHKIFKLKGKLLINLTIKLPPITVNSRTFHANKKLILVKIPHVIA